MPTQNANPYSFLEENIKAWSETTQGLELESLKTMVTIFFLHLDIHFGGLFLTNVNCVEKFCHISKTERTNREGDLNQIILTFIKIELI